MLQQAEERLAAWVRTPDEAIVETEGRLDRARLEKERLEGPLAALYEQLEKTLRGAGGADRSLFTELAELDGVLESYRVRYELLERHAKRS